MNRSDSNTGSAASSPDDARRLAEFLDRQEILTVLARYARGVDRALDRRRVVRRPIVDHDRLPILFRLCQQRVQRSRQQAGTIERTDDNAEERSHEHRR